MTTEKIANGVWDYYDPGKYIAVASGQIAVGYNPNTGNYGLGNAPIYGTVNYSYGYNLLKLDYIGAATVPTMKLIISGFPMDWNSMVLTKHHGTTQTTTTWLRSAANYSSNNWWTWSSATNTIGVTGDLCDYVFLT